MIKMSDLKKKTDTELVEVVKSAREAVRKERFKDKFSKKVNVIKSAKKEIARSLTELSQRRRKTNVK